MKQNKQFVKVNTAFIEKSLSAGAVKVLFLLASVAQASGGDTAIISNARIAERTGLTNITRLTNELYAIGAITERIQRYKANRQKCNAYVLSETVCAPQNYVLVPVPAVTLPKSCLRLFILYCLNARSGRCLLSLSIIQKLSGMARGTIISCNEELTRLGFIAKQRYKRREGSYGYNRVYISHMLQRTCGVRTAEAFRAAVNSNVLCYESKCEVENSLTGRFSTGFLILMRQLFRSTKIPLFIRKIIRFVKSKDKAVFLCQNRGSQILKRRIINIKPVLII